MGTLYLPPNPWAFLSLLPAYVVGEAWLGICLTVVIELVPIEVAPASVALFVFISSNISSIVPLFLPLLHDIYDLQRTMLILFPGLYLVAATLFCGSLIILTALDLRNKVKCKRSSPTQERRQTSDVSPLLQEVYHDSQNTNTEDSMEQGTERDPASPSPRHKPIIIVNPSLNSRDNRGRRAGEKERNNYGSACVVGSAGHLELKVRSVSNRPLLRTPSLEEVYLLAKSQEGL